MLNQSLSIDNTGHLNLGGVDTLELAAQFGTPLYVMDEATIRRACGSYRESIKQFYDGKGMALYASKAFSCKEIYRIVESEGMGVDVVSAGELYTARQAGFPAERIYFHGNNKTDEELRFALEEGVGCLVADHLDELRRLSAMLDRMGKKQRILLRIKPGVDAHTHDFVRTGQIDSKFGFALETGEALVAVREALSLPGIELIGIHCHIGSQIFDVDPFCHTADLMVGFLGEIKRECGVELSVLNLGGGFGVKYVESQNPVPYTNYMQRVSETIVSCCTRENIQRPFVLLEPGRSIVAHAGITLYTAGCVKKIPGIRTYISVDGGMGDNPRYALYHAEYTALVANRAGEAPTQKVTLAGKCCESGDLLGENMPLQSCQPGDIIALLCTGAYNYSMASNYNRLPRPAVVMVKDGEPRVIVRRETLEDLTRNDL